MPDISRHTCLITCDALWAASVLKLARYLRRRYFSFFFFFFFVWVGYLFTRDALRGVPCLKTGRFLFTRNARKGGHV